jgi:hypothetical protein
VLTAAAENILALVAEFRREASEKFRHRLYEITRERQLGIVTSEDDPENGSPTEYQPYVAAPYACLDTAFAAAGVGSGDVFLDYGCGRGRVVAVAATLPFARVIGIEMRPELSAAAERNVRTVRGRRCGASEVVTGDATAYVVPDDVTVAFLFNPFTRDVLRATCERLRESFVRRPRELRVVYMNPLEDPDLLADCGWLERTRDLSPGRWSNMRFGVYRGRVG